MCPGFPLLILLLLLLGLFRGAVFETQLLLLLGHRDFVAEASEI